MKKPSAVPTMHSFDAPPKLTGRDSVLFPVEAELHVVSEGAYLTDDSI